MMKSKKLSLITLQHKKSKSDTEVFEQEFLKKK